MEKTKSIGALWLKESKSGMAYMSGVIELDEKKTQIVVFKNNKEKENQPDYRILESKPMGEQKPTEKEEDISNIPF